MPFAPHEIEHKKFVVALRGYEKDEVEAFLRAVAADYRALSDNGAAREAVSERRATLAAERERLVREDRDEHPQLADSWEFTLYHLRQHADVDGRLPLLFDAMIEEVFGPLLDR